jgi:hypothetical protein
MPIHNAIKTVMAFGSNIDSSLKIRILTNPIIESRLNENSTLIQHRVLNSSLKALLIL